MKNIVEQYGQGIRTGICLLLLFFLFTEIHVGQNKGLYAILAEPKIHEKNAETEAMEPLEKQDIRTYTLARIPAKNEWIALNRLFAAKPEDKSENAVSVLAVRNERGEDQLLENNAALAGDKICFYKRGCYQVVIRSKEGWKETMVLAIQ